MSFTLHVEFSGLCLYVRHISDPSLIAVLLPDARPGTNPQGTHIDELLGEVAEPHVGYVRLDAANLPEQLPHAPQASDDPRYELIHRLNREVLVFDDGFEPTPINEDLNVPEFDRFAPGLELLPGLFGPTPPPQLLARTFLRGGSLTSVPTAELWTVPDDLNPGMPAMTGNFASSVLWTRPVQGNSTTLRITDFTGTTQRQFSLAPVEGQNELYIKVANLCAYNPLEWEDLPLREVMGSDVDFKWLYRLHRPQGGVSYQTYLAGKNLPIPVRAEIPPLNTGSNDCIPGGTRTTF